MKFSQLTIEKFGHFEPALQLQFPADAPFVVIYGPNEAGKTTLLHAIHGFLFGIEERSAYNFKFPYRDMQVRACLQDSAGQILELTRYKRRKDSLIGTLHSEAGSVDMNESRFMRYFGDINEQLYRSIFGFTHIDLQRGAEVLQIAGLQELLSGGALGGSGESIRNVLRQLQEQQEELFKARGKNPHINRLLSELRELKTDLNNATLRKSDYEQLTKQLADICQTIDQTDERVQALRLRGARVQTLQDAYEDVYEQRKLSQQIESPGLQSPFDEQTAREVSHLLERLATLREQASVLADEYEHSQQRLQSYQIDHVLLAEGKTLDRLVKSLEYIEQQRQSLWKQEQAFKAALAELDWTFIDHLRSQSQPLERTSDEACLQELAWLVRIPDAEFQRFEAACAEWQQKNQELRTLEQAITKQKAEIEQLEVVLQEHNKQLPSQELRELLFECEEIHEKFSYVEQKKRELEQLEQTNLTCEAELKPAIAGDRLAKLILPSMTQVRECSDQLRTIQLQLVEANQKISTLEVELKGFQAEYETLLSHEKLPQAGELFALREQREQLWSKICQIARQEDLQIDREEVLRQYEASTRAIDELADRMRFAAESIAQQRNLQQKIAHYQARCSYEQQIHHQLLQHDEQAMNRWQALWKDLPFSPRTPSEMFEWLMNAQELQKRWQKNHLLSQEIAQLMPSLVQFSQRLGHHLQVPSASWPQLHKKVRQQEREIQHVQGRIVAMQERRWTLQASVEQQFKSQQQLQAQLESCQKNLKVISQVFRPQAHPNPELAGQTTGVYFDLHTAKPTMSGRLSEYEELQQSIQKLWKLRTCAKQLAEQKADILHKKAIIGDFEAKVNELNSCLSVQTAYSLLADPPRSPEVLIEHLSQRLVQTRADLSAQKQITEQLVRKEQQLNGVKKALSSVVSRLNGFREMALDRQAHAQGSQDIADQQLIRFAEQALQVGELKQRWNDLEIRLVRMFGERRNEYEAELHQTSKAALQAEQVELDQQISLWEAKRTELAEKKGKCEQVLAQLGGDRAAIVHGRMQERMAELNEYVERYVLVHMAHQTLDRVTERYAREYQPGILQTTSELLAKISNGQHIRVISEPSANTLAVIGADGESRFPRQLSLGTRELLFFALRLAYVLEYCERGEALPVIMDDVLINFDQERAFRSLQVLTNVAQTTQILFLTCHRHLVDLCLQFDPKITLLQMPGSAQVE